MHRKKTGRKGRLLIPACFVTLFLTGICLLAYPWISNYLYENRAASVIDIYDEEIEDVDDAEIEQLLSDAQEYNEALSQIQYGMSYLPYPIEDLENNPHEIFNRLDYESTLSLNGSIVMGYIDIPEIDVYLPVLHGTDDATLLAGIGHMEGTSLPIGGESTHAVLTGHTGLSSAKMFTDLTELETGDMLYFHVLGETLAYEIVEIQVVEPDNIEALYIQDGRDLMTLVTCTPYGINSHRLYVTGERTEYVESVYEKSYTENKATSSQWMRQYRRGVIIGLLIVFGVASLVIVISGIRKRSVWKKRRNMVH